jgi:DNA-binding transcriptional ArsR family regulator
MNGRQLKKAIALLEVLANETRINILETIQDNEPVCVTDIYGKLHMEQSITSQQLKILRQYDFVSTTRNSRTIYYSINKKKLLTVQKAIEILQKSSKE